MNAPARSYGKFHHIPTTIITGFLGAGKTTAINHLLNHKPSKERWAVLVNEFGQVGVDASLLSPRREVSIREISGGCLCCTAGASFEAALNRLIRDTSPQRILIEPTGIGHPLKIIRTLCSGYFQEVLDLKATICLVDARKLGDVRYREHPSFQDQLNLADLLIASKADCYTARDRTAFLNLAASAEPPKAMVAEISFGQLDPLLLDYPRNRSRSAGFPDAHTRKNEPSASAVSQNKEPETAEPVRPDSWTLHEGSGSGYSTGSWLIGSGYRFRQTALAALLNTLPFERVKGVMQCRDGWMSINGGEGQFTLSSGAPLNSSRLEIMDPAPLHTDEIDRQLRDTLCLSGDERGDFEC
ncbi:CobW family GTP-binding protein [Chlorobium ferrooxidans]|uniref:Cobalamin synthesis protein, P47K n=1 Tax=Chlorobium ferrooxidans DSM 13031 TaxID=377431 RepID=Q0YSN5_9CHLB|nr:GTP-binding protein [Chlorobium ferrooxidans]EAT59349.1 Cobalamin synthesis protein, P47K [Chlorobium ferrooxidans DSM 13031]